ncbi:hypothetical protein [Desulfocicer vacuolatum]|uniref:hypothetical protein n=1 Tax=Desulfocicer vacuolatum TaxID=2298 RepID=UPI001BAFE0AB|nr:hypothetical protein [Desulfocicer vacuolatum]
MSATDPIHYTMASRFSRTFIVIMVVTSAVRRSSNMKYSAIQGIFQALQVLNTSGYSGIRFEYHPALKGVTDIINPQLLRTYVRKQFFWQTQQLAA